MSEKEEKIVYIITCSGDNPDKVSFPFVMANAALTMDVKAVIVLQGAGVYLAKKGYVDNVFASGLPPLKELMETFLKAGGELLVCDVCLRVRKIETDDIIEGSKPIASAYLTQEILSATSTLVY